MDNGTNVRPEYVFSWKTERFPFTRQDIEPNEDGAWEASYGTVEDFDEELGGVPFTVFNQILMRTWEGYGEQAFIDLLNEPTASPRHLITFFEKEFRANERKSPGTPFFSRKYDWPFIKAKRHCDFMPKDEFPFLIELAELERWAQRNPDILPDKVDVYGSDEDIIRLEYEAALAAQKAENESLRAKIAELENAPQKAAEGATKPIDPREKKTLLRLIHAALSLNKSYSVDYCHLAGILVAKCQNLYPETAPDQDTVKKKLNEIIALYAKESE